jgi:hypothetical protein
VGPHEQQTRGGLAGHGGLGVAYLHILNARLDASAQLDPVLDSECCDTVPEGL